LLPTNQSGVRYQQEPPEGKPEKFAAIPEILSRSWGDCDDLAPWRVAELREAGEKAKIRITWRRNGGRRLHHVVVRRGDGRIEAPLKAAGDVVMLGKHSFHSPSVAAAATAAATSQESQVLETRESNPGPSI